MRFIGRSGELASLMAHARAAAEEQRLRVVVLIAAPGAGASRLLDELGKRWAGGQYARVGASRGPVGASQWERLLAGLGIESLAGQGPLVGVLDELHHSDEQTLTVLADLAANPPTVPALIVAVCRPGSDALTGPAVHRLWLTGLTRAEVAEYLAILTGCAVSPALAGQLWRRTDGAPAILGAIAGQLRPGDDGRRRIALRWPNPFHSDALETLAELSENTRSVLCAASVVGREFDLALVEHVVGGDALAAIDSAVAAGVLRELPAQVFAFTTALYREVCYDSLGVKAAAALHERVADALSAVGARVGDRAPTVAELAHHLTVATVLSGHDRCDAAITAAVAAANVTEDPAEAVSWFVTATELAVRAAWPAGALGRLLVALGSSYLAAAAAAEFSEVGVADTDLGDRLGTGSPAMGAAGRAVAEFDATSVAGRADSQSAPKPGLGSEFSQVAAGAGDGAALRNSQAGPAMARARSDEQEQAGWDALAAATRLGREAGDAELLAAAALGYGPRPGAGVTRAPSDPIRQRALREALTALERQERPDLSLVARVRARLALEAADAAGAPGAADVAGTWGRVAGTADVAGQAGAAGGASGGEAEELARKAIAAATECADPRALAEALLAHPAVDLRSARSAVREAGALGDAGLLTRAYQTTATLLLRSGEVTAADQQLARLAELVTVPSARLQAVAHRALLAGRLGEAEAVAGRALAGAGGAERSSAELGHAATLAVIALVRGEPGRLGESLKAMRGRQPAWTAAASAWTAAAEGETELARVLIAEVAESEPDPWTAVLLAESMLLTGVDDEIAGKARIALSEHGEEWLVLGPAAATAGPVSLALAKLLIALGDLDAAAQALSTADSLTGRTIWRPWLHYTRACWHLAGSRAGRQTHAETVQRELSTARAGATAAGLTGLVAQIDRHSPGTSTVLTRREVDILRLALDGASTREIAERLVIGARTVETHLANLYRKLGIRNRSELFARAAELRAQAQGYPAV